MDPKTEWKMQDGRVVKIADMENRHLVNTIRMVYRRAFYSHVSALNLIDKNEEAYDGVDFDLSDEQLVTVYGGVTGEALLREAKKRRLDWFDRDWIAKTVKAMLGG